MKMQIKTVLKELGLNERHASIFIACLELGSSSIHKISEKSGFARSTCESVLKSLQKRGMVTSFKNKKTLFYSPEDPKAILKSEKEKIKNLEEALPLFSARYFKGNILPNARLYQGIEGAKKVLNEILEEIKVLKSFGSADDVYEILGVDFKNFSKNRAVGGKLAKVIIKDSELARQRQRLGPEELREVRILPNNFNPNGIIFIWENKIAMFALKNEFIILVIESKELSALQENMFDIIWQSLEK